MSERKPQSKAGVFIIVAVGLLVTLCCLWLGAILLGWSTGFHVKKPVMSEVKSNLKYAFTAQRSFFMEKDRYGESPSEIGFMPEKGNRYAYFLGDGGVIDVDRVKFPSAAPLAAMQAALPTEVAAQLGVRGECPDHCESTVAAVGNIDGDATLDVWSISTAERKFGADTASAGSPYNHVNDVEK